MPAESFNRNIEVREQPAKAPVDVPALSDKAGVAIKEKFSKIREKAQSDYGKVLDPQLKSILTQQNNLMLSAYSKQISRIVEESAGFSAKNLEFMHAEIGRLLDELQTELDKINTDVSLVFQNNIPREFPVSEVVSAMEVVKSSLENIDVDQLKKRIQSFMNKRENAAQISLILNGNANA